MFLKPFGGYDVSWVNDPFADAQPLFLNIFGSLERSALPLEVDIVPVYGAPGVSAAHLNGFRAYAGSSDDAEVQRELKSSLVELDLARADAQAGSVDGLIDRIADEVAARVLERMGVSGVQAEDAADAPVPTGEAALDGGFAYVAEPDAMAGPPGSDPVQDGGAGPMPVLKDLEEGGAGPMPDLKDLESGSAGPMNDLKALETGTAGPMELIDFPVETAPAGPDSLADILAAFAAEGDQDAPRFAPRSNNFGDHSPLDPDPFGELWDPESDYYL